MGESLNTKSGSRKKTEKPKVVSLKVELMELPKAKEV